VNFRGKDQRSERNELKNLNPTEDLKSLVEEDGSKQEGHLRVGIQKSPGPDDYPEWR